jgi:hypothetical protein
MMSVIDVTDAQYIPQPRPREVIKARIDGEDVVLIGTVPTGIPAIMCPVGWEIFRRWKLTTFRISRGSLRAGGKGHASGNSAARFLLDAPKHHAVLYRNGNFLDVRLSNIVSVSRGLIRQAGIEASRPPGYKNPDVHWGEGRCHAGVPVKDPSAGDRITAMLGPVEDPDI